jgi:hypothetical protein
MDKKTFNDKDFEYTILDNGKIEIASYIGTDYEIVIPSAIEGRSVYSIGEGAFRSLNISSVKLGALIEVIEDYAFCECSRLESVEIPETLSVIGDYAFFGTKLEEIYFPMGLDEIGRFSFAFC